MAGQAERARSVRLANERLEVLLPLDVGPRILSYRLLGGENVLREYPDSFGGGGEKEFVVRGGHRLWIAPEEERTYAPDNVPVSFARLGEQTVSLEGVSGEPWHPVRKKLTVTLEADALRVDHEVTNVGVEALSIAAWALTIMAPGGLEIIPQPPLAAHGKGPPGREFLPDRVLVPWPFTDLSDERWKLGRRLITLRPVPGGPPTKLGLTNLSGWAAYLLPHALFLKSVDYLPGEVYPDFGCNYETFALGDFIELETLSPLRRLEPGQAIRHCETWHLFGGIHPPNPLDEAALVRWLEPFVSKLAR